MKPYRPVSCDFHSELELLALRRTICTIRFLAENGEEAQVETRLQDLRTRDGEEFLLLPDGTEIRLDRLVSVNGLLAKGW